AVPAQRHFRDHWRYIAWSDSSWPLEGVFNKCVSQRIAGQPKSCGQLWTGAVL
ncbi:hypothetical protein IWW35_005966, partial [Coemansia sp. RSA 1878]